MLSPFTYALIPYVGVGEWSGGGRLCLVSNSNTADGRATLRWMRRFGCALLLISSCNVAPKQIAADADTSSADEAGQPEASSIDAVVAEVDGNGLHVPEGADGDAGLEDAPALTDASVDLHSEQADGDAGLEDVPALTDASVDRQSSAESSTVIQPTVLVAEFPIKPEAERWLAVTRNGLYWAGAAQGGSPPGAVWTVGVAGGTPSIFATDLGLADQGIGANGDQVYWGSFWYGVMTLDSTGTLTTAVSGKRVQTVIFGGNNVCVEDRPIYEWDHRWCASLVDGHQLISIVGLVGAVDATSVYSLQSVQQPRPERDDGGWTGAIIAHRLVRTTFDPPTTITLATIPPVRTLSIPMTVEGGYVYWSNDGTLSKTAIDGGLVVTLATESANSLAVDASHIYWTNTLEGTVKRMPLTGGSPETLATGQLSPGTIVLDDTFVYWGNRLPDAITLLKIAK